MSTYETTLSALGTCLAAGVPTLLWGPPGDGKTSAVRATADALGLHTEVVLASLRDPSDFAGLPIPDVSTGTVRLAPPSWAQRLVDAGARGVRPLLFLDEVSCASPATQAALLRVCADRVVGDLALPADTVVLAAANPPGVAADGWDLAAPMANRFVHLPWKVPAAVVADGLLGAWPLPQVPVPVGLRRHETAARALIASYLRARPTDVSVVPTGATEAGRAFPTPRSWENAARLLAVCAAAGLDDDVARVCVAGAVGDAAALQLFAYRGALDLPDPEEVLADPTSLTLPERGDRAYAVLAAVVATVLADCTPERWTAGVRAVCRAAELGRPDVGAPAVTVLLRHRPPGSTVVPDELTAFAPVLQKAGLL